MRNAITCTGRDAAFFMPLRRTGTVPNTTLSSCAGLARASTSCFAAALETWMAGTGPAMTAVAFGTTPALQRNAAQVLRAALRPGNGVLIQRPFAIGTVERKRRHLDLKT